jgi:hypothetical protein
MNWNFLISTKQVVFTLIVLTMTAQVTFQPNVNYGRNSRNRDRFDWGRHLWSDGNITSGPQIRCARRRAIRRTVCR